MLHNTRKGRAMDLMLSDTPMYYAGGGFPWGLLIIGGIVYFLWSKGMFNGRGRFGNGGHFGGGGYGSSYGPAQAPDSPGYGPGAEAGHGSTPGFGGPRAMFDEWHRQAHETAGSPPHTQSHIASPTTATSEAPASGDGAPAR
jgi:hypothetical protein